MVTDKTQEVEDQDKDVTDEELRQATESLNKPEELGDTSEESTPKEKTPPATSSEDDKSVTGSESDEQKPVPYSRFKEVNDKAKQAAEYEEFLSQNKDKVVRNPVTGKLEFVQTQNPPETEKPVKYDDELTEEEKLLFDESQLKVIEKLTAKREREALARIDAQNKHREESTAWWNKTQEEFPDVKKADSPLYQRANKILLEKYAQLDKSGKTVVYIPPRAHYLATLEADRELAKEAKAKAQAEAEEKKNKQDVVVTKKATTKPSSSKTYSEDDIDNMSSDDMDKVMKEEFERNKEKLNL